MLCSWLNMVMCFLVLNFQAPVPVFKDGKKAMDRFVSENLIYPLYSRNNCIQARVEVSFKLNRAGEVTWSEVTLGPGIDLDDEALRLVRMSSGKWRVPAVYNENTVLVFPVIFAMNDPACSKLGTRDTQKSIKLYRDQQLVMQAISNYYKQVPDIVNHKEDQRILGLKNELGIDDAYYDGLIELAEKKLAQGDRAGACADLKQIRDLGSTRAAALLRQYCE